MLKRLVMMFALAGLVIGGVGANGVSAETAVAPLPACDGPARTAEEIAELKLKPADRQRDRVERTGEASAEDTEAIAETIANWFACLVAQDSGRIAALLTDQLVSRDLFPLSFEDDEEPLDGLTFLGVYQAWNLSDGRVIAVLAADDPSQTYPMTSIVLVFAKVDGSWLIDDVSF